MKNQKIFTAVLLISFVFTVNCKSNNKNAIKSGGIYAYGGSQMEEQGFYLYVYEFTNISEKTITAFSARITYYDEFDNVLLQKYSQLTTEMTYIDDDGKKSVFSGFKPGQTIYLYHITGGASGNRVLTKKGVMNSIKKKHLFKFEPRKGVKCSVKYEKIIFADE